METFSLVSTFYMGGLYHGMGGTLIGVDRMKNFVAALAVSVFALPAFADGHFKYTYEQFEVSIPHFDLEECPASMKLEKAFCRLVAHGDAMHVYAFSEEGDSQLIAFKTFDEGDFDVILK